MCSWVLWEPPGFLIAVTLSAIVLVDPLLPEVSLAFGQLESIGEIPTHEVSTKLWHALATHFRLGAELGYKQLHFYSRTRWYSHYSTQHNVEFPMYSSGSITISPWAGTILTSSFAIQTDASLFQLLVHRV